MSYKTPKLLGDVTGSVDATVVSAVDGYAFPSPTGNNTALVLQGGTLAWGYQMLSSTLATTNWYIDPSAGNDSNSGTSSGAPLKTFKRLAQILGPQPWVFLQDTVVTFLSDHATTTDPIFADVIAHGGSLTITTTPTVASTGTISAITVQTIGNPGTRLTMTLPGSPSIGMLVVNNTKGSVGIVEVVSGSISTVTQPYLAQNPPTVFSETTDNTWANGDSVTTYNLGQLTVGSLKGVVSDYDSNFNAPITIWRANLVQEGSYGDIPFTGQIGLLESWANVPVAFAGIGEQSSYNITVGFTAFISGGGSGTVAERATSMEFQGGFIYGGARISLAASYSWISIGPNGAELASGYVNGPIWISSVAGGGVDFHDTVLIDTVILPGTLNVSASTNVPTTSSCVGFVVVGGTISFASQPGIIYKVAAVTSSAITLSTAYTGTVNAATTGIYPTGQIWGPGFVDVDFGKLLYAPNNTATAIFQCTNGILIDGVNVGIAIDKSVEPAIIHPVRTFTAAAIDLAVASGGFGGNAWGANGSFIGVHQQTISAPVAYVAPVANGGTGLGTLTTHNVLLGQGTSALHFAAPGAAGTVLVSGGATVDPTFVTITNSSLTAGTFSSITGTGTLTAGATGAGFTINLGASTISGTLPVADLTAGTSGQILINSATPTPTWTTVSGDITIGSTGATTLATVNSNVGSFGSGTQVAAFTVNAKGLITAASNVTITGAAPSGAAGGDLGGTYPNPNVISVTHVTTGVLTVTNGGTGLATLTAHNVVLGEGTSNVAFAAPGAAGTVLVSGGVSTDPSFTTITNTSLTAGTFSNITGTGTLTAGATGAGFTIALTTSTVTGTLTVTHGGTGLATLTAHSVLLGEGTSNVAFASPVAAGYVLTDNGVSADPTFQVPFTGILPPANGSWTVGAWFIDPVSGSDTANTGLTSGSPFKTYAHLASLWGTYSPRLRQNTTITFLSSHSNDSDPVYFNPLVENSAVVAIVGTRTQVATGTLSGVVSKNVSTPQLLNATLTSGLSAGRLIVNSTHASEAWLYKNVTGNTWAITEPLTVATIPYTSPTEVDTWANGDTYTVYSLSAVNIVEFSPMLIDINSAFTSLPTLSNLTIYDPLVSFGSVNINASQFVLQNINIQRMLNCSTVLNGPIHAPFINCYIDEYFTIEGNTVDQPIMYGGVFTVNSAAFLTTTGIAFDTILASGSLAYMIGPTSYGSIYIETGTTLNFGGSGIIGNFGGGLLWGPGVVNINNGNPTVQYPTGAGQAVATFKNTGGLRIQGSSVAYSINNNTLNSNISLTAANLDAAAGPAGFGGTAFTFTGGSFSNLATTQLSALSQTTWFIDPTSGNDSNTGLTSGTALKTKAQLVQRWGSLTPVITVAVTITFLNSDTVVGDPWIATPICLGSGSVTLTGQLTSSQLSFTGSLLAVTAKKNSGGGADNALQSTFTTTNGAMASGLLLVNLSKSNSRAFAQKNIGSNNWQISQPLAAYTQGVFPTYPPTEVDTWANGDTIDGYTLTAVDAAILGSYIGNYQSTGGLFTGMFVNSLSIANIQNNYDHVEFAGNAFTMIEGRVLRAGIANGGAGKFDLESLTFINVDFSGNTFSAEGAGFFGGIIRGAGYSLKNCGLSSDLIFATTNTVLTQKIQDCFFGSMFIDTTTLHLNGQCAVGSSLSAPAFGLQVLYGTGVVDVRSGLLQYPSGAGNAAATLRTTLNILGNTTALSSSAGGINSVSLTAANLDATAGTAGFGGNALTLFGASITNGTIPTGFSTFSGTNTRVSALKTSNYNVIAGTDYVVAIGTLSAGITVTLPSGPSTGDTYIIKDVNGSASTFPITVSGNGNNIDGASTYSVATNYASMTVTFTGSTWSIL